MNPGLSLPQREAMRQQAQGGLMAMRLEIASKVYPALLPVFIKEEFGQGIKVDFDTAAKAAVQAAEALLVAAGVAQRPGA